MNHSEVQKHRKGFEAAFICKIAQRTERTQEKFKKERPSLPLPFSHFSVP